MNRNRGQQRLRHQRQDSGQDFHRRRNRSALTADRLQDLHTQDPNKITLILASSLEPLKELLNQTMDYGLTKLFLRVLRKSLHSISLKEKNNEILSVLMYSDFPLNISRMLAEISLSNEGLVEFLQNLMYILKTILLQNPSEYVNVLKIIGVLDIILQDLDESTIDDVENLMMKYVELQTLLQKLSKQKRKQKNEEALPSFDSPPEDFRSLAVVPTTETIHSKDKIFLRPNKVKGAYDDVDHYLDVQFRLIRQDFFGPLQEGIKQYLALENEQKYQHIDDLRIYHQVHILCSMCTSNGIAYKVSFDVSHSRINWAQSNRLIYGSLVCLTPDDFQTNYFATVADRNIEELKEGYIDLLFFSSCEDISRLPSTTVFIMAETTAYFEAYRHILTALKEIRDDNMPFQDYIIHGKSDVKPPNYLTQNKHIDMDLTCITDNYNLVYNSRKEVVNFEESPTNNLSLKVLHDPWPSAENFKLNDSQNEALENALTKEFSLTQGPPGTGKTYIGLKIVKALCYNCNLWRGNGKSPMLIVCYTNQALDKFLEGIASFLDGGILRVGGRSNSEVLSKYLLRKVKMAYRYQKSFTDEFMRNKHLSIGELKDIKSEIEKITNQIKLTKRGILHENILEDHMDQFYDWLVKGFEDNYGCQNRKQNSRSMSVLIQWLGYGNIEILEMDADNPNVDHENGAADNADTEFQERAEGDGVAVYTETDFIQQNRMIKEDDDLQKEFSGLEIDDNDVVALKIDDFDRIKEISTDGFEKTKKEKKRLRNRLQRDLKSNTLLEDEEVDQIRYHDLWFMNRQKRWKLYRRWVASYCNQLRDKITQKEIRYNTVTQTYKELQHYEDGVIMKDSLVIGMTTSAAAKYHGVLQEIQPKIIIVEEAAEILEAHIVTALNPMCEQLILIGDHKQLRPNPNVYELARNFNLEVSLFERMVLNNCLVKCLSHQHRMRPEISQLMHPIYSELQDHISVTKYENIKGLASNVYFIQHDEPEKTYAETSSYSNPHEACFVVELCKYILKQGYCPSQITILTTYMAQLFELKKLMKNDFFAGIRLTVVDNYQGEENDIVLLSLVRNNSDRKVGFLKIDNRVSVALSRAKMGFYVIGNFEILSNQSKLWKRILLILKSKDLIGRALTLCCQNHPNREIQIREKSDFSQSPEGGCLKPCESRLECGHTCKRVCHPVDDHDVYKCLEKCTRVVPGCPENHKCTLICSEECSPCMKIMAKIIPSCNHQQMVACYQDPNTFKCKEMCQRNLPCGHQCVKSCGEICSSECKVEVYKTYPCKHTVKSLCFRQNASCPEPCLKRLDCGHQCSGTCGGCPNKRIHSVCSHGCQKLLVCGHQCSNKQCNVCSPCVMPCQNRCIHNKCMKSCGELCTPCKEPCQWRCEHYQCSRYCHESCDRPKCDKACLKLLHCQHPCVGLCGETCPRLCRMCNYEELTEIFFGTEKEEGARFVQLEDCGHILEQSSLDTWMSQETDGEIQLKVCPKCKVPIRRNLRYGQIINKITMDIDKVKDKLIGDRQEINTLIFQIEIDLEKFSQNYRDYFRCELEQSKNKSSLSYWYSFTQRISFLLILRQLKKKPILKEDSLLLKHCKDLSQWLLHHRETLSKAESEETELEVERIRKILQFYEARKKFKTLQIPEESNMKDLIESGLQLLTSKDYSSVKDEVSKIVEGLSAVISTISEQERINVVKAIDVPRGHWFKCPKGHYYVIGDCGGATERSKCPDCGSTIGGENHSLEAGNTLAGEMDGAQYAAYSDQANLANYQF